MPLKVTLVSPRSKSSLGKSGKSSVSVTSEFEFMNLPQLRSPRKVQQIDTSTSSNRAAAAAPHTGRVWKQISEMSEQAPPPPRASLAPPPARPPKSSPSPLPSSSPPHPTSPLPSPLADPPSGPSAFRPGKGRTSTLTSPPPLASLPPPTRPPSSEVPTLRLPSPPRSSPPSPSPPPPPSLSCVPEDQEDLPPPPSYSTLKRLSAYRRSDRESKREQKARMQEAGEREAAPERGEERRLEERGGLPSRLEERGVLPPRLEERIVPSRLEERLNMTVTGAEPSSPSREAAKAAAGWAKFHGRTAGRSVSVLLAPEEAAAIRSRRSGGGGRGERQEQNRRSRGEQEEVSEEEPPPPLPPKPRTKISVMGSPNSEHFIVMDNSALFSARQKREGEEKELNSGEEEKEESRSEVKKLSESHSRSDSGLSSLSSWTAPTSKSGCSSVRSSSIVSDCSSKIEELLEEEVGGGRSTTTFLSTCSLKLENLVEHDELIEKQDKEVEEDEQEDQQEEEEYDDVCQSSSAVQRQLETIRQQKSELIREIVNNEEVGMALQGRLEAVSTEREQEKYGVFLSELEKVVLLVFSVSSRLRKVEEELACGGLADWEQESCRYRRDKLARQLREAQELRAMSDRRMGNVEVVIRKGLEEGEQEVELFRSYISRKEELLISQRACEDLEKNILH